MKHVHFLFALLQAVLSAIFAPVPRRRAQFGGLDVDTPLELKHLVDGVDKIKQTVELRLKDVDKLALEQGELKTRMTGLEQIAVKGNPLEKSNAIHDALVEQKSQLEDFTSRRGQHKRVNFAMPGLSIKALVNAGNDPDSNNDVYHGGAQRAPGPVGTVLRPTRLLDVLPRIPVTSNAYEFAKISWSGEADVQQGEGAKKAEVIFDGEPSIARIATIAVLTTASTQVLADSTRLQAELERIMRNMVLRKLEQQLLTGSGTGYNIDGLYTQAPELNTNLDPVVERIGDALQQMETEGYSPNVVLLNPANWFRFATMKDSQGRYMFGSPMAPVAPSLFNRPVVTSPAVPIDRVLVGDTSFAEVLDREEPTFAASFENDDNFVRNLVTLRVELRAGLAVYNTGAFRKVALDPRS